ncbi:unnamed protein product [Camellia sinensis]
MTKKLGRKFSMLMGGCVFCCGALLNAFAVHLTMLIIGRILLGVGVGFATHATVCVRDGFIQIPWNPQHMLSTIHHNWHSVPAVMFLSSLWVFATPNSLIKRGHFDKAKKQLQRIRGVADIQAEFNNLVDASAASKEAEHPWRNLLMSKYRPQLCLPILIPIFQQLTGINVVMFYAPVLFKTIGFQSNASLASAMITGGVNVLATLSLFLGLIKWGRKPLFLWDGGIMLVFQSAVSILVGAKFGVTGDATNLEMLYSSILVCCICIFVTAFAFSWGPLGWLVPSKIFPLKIRSSAQNIVVAVNMSFTFLVAQIFLFALCMVKFGLFIIFAGLVLIMSLFVIFFVSETNNIPIEEMSQVWRGHWYWKKFVDDEMEIKMKNGSP